MPQSWLWIKTSWRTYLCYYFSSYNSSNMENNTVDWWYLFAQVFLNSAVTSGMICSHWRASWCFLFLWGIASSKTGCAITGRDQIQLSGDCSDTSELQGADIFYLQLWVRLGSLCVVWGKSWVFVHVCALACVFVFSMPDKC